MTRYRTQNSTSPKKSAWTAVVRLCASILVLFILSGLMAGLMPGAGLLDARLYAVDDPELIWDTPPDGESPPIEDIRADAWYVYDRSSGKMIFEKNPDTVLFPASTTKIMTAVLAIESGDMDRMVTVSTSAVNLTAASSKVGFVAGEVVVMRDVIAGLMVASGNDSANIIAETLAGSNAAFAVMMNAKARKLGMTNSNFCNPSGLQDYSHVVTARDMATLTDYALDIPEFRELVSLRTYAMPSTNKHPYLGWGLFTNTNRLLVYGDSAFRSDYIRRYIGVKTGSTDVAGNNLVSAAITAEGHELICVLLGVPSGIYSCTTFNYSRTLLVEAAKQTSSQPSEETKGSTGANETASSTVPGGNTESGESIDGDTTTAESMSGTDETTGQESGTTGEAGVVTTQSSGNPGNPGISGKTGLLGFLTDNLWRTLVLGILAIIVCTFFWRFQQAKRQRRRRRAKTLPIKPRRVDIP